METKLYSLYDNLNDGDAVLWSLRLNAVVRHKEPGAVKSGKKNCIVDDARKGGASGHSLDIAATVVPDWLSPRLAAAGLASEASDMRVERYTKMQFSKGPGSRENISLGVTDLIGRGTVKDADAFRLALAKGFGSGRSYGCGLMLVRRDLHG
jgi:CRISPR system Cascade subunit CasE